MLLACVSASICFTVSITTKTITCNSKLRKELEEAGARNAKRSAKTREGMRSALDTFMKKWTDAIDTKDEKVKDDFEVGLDKLVKNSAEDNGVWQMMVCASALHT